MGKTADALIKLGVEGASEFQATLRQETNEIKRLKEEYKVLSTGFSDTDRSANRFEKQIESLTKVLDAQRKKQQEIQQTLDSLKNSTSDADKETDEYKNAVSDLEHQLNSATIEANKTERQIDKLGKEMDETGNDTKEASVSMGDLQNAMKKAQVVANLAASAIKTVAKYVFEGAKAAVNYNKDMEKATKSLETFVGVEGTKDIANRMKALTKQTGVSTVSLLQQAQSLTAVGVSGDQAATTIEGMSKVITALGGDNATFERMLTNMQGIYTNTKATTQDMKQFKMAGIPIMQMLSESTGKSVAELEKMDITFDMISEAFAHASSEGGAYFEAIQAGASTLDGQVNILKASIMEGLGTAFEPVNTALREDLMPVLLEIAENIDWTKIGEGISGAVTAISEFIEKVEGFQDWYDSIYGEPAQETIDGFTTSVEDAGLSFLDSAGNLQVFDETMLNSVEDAKRFRGGMHLEMDGYKTESATTLREAAGEAKEILIDQGWEMMAQGETNSQKLAEGIRSGEVSVRSETAQVVGGIQEELDRKKGIMYTSGKDFVSGFASGMHDNNGLIANAAASIANTIKRWLHFSRPDVGPLREYDTWARDFVTGYADAITRNIGKIENASRQMATAMANPIYNSSNSYDNKTINMTVNSNNGQDAEDIADYVIYKLGVETDRKMRT